jgi:anti-sigma regulatory factor (Ser/Thr protein kinase)
MNATGSTFTATVPGDQATTEASGAMPPLAALPTAAAAARAHVRSTLASWEMDHLADAAEAAVSELVANAVNASTDEHGHPVYRDGRILMVWVRLREHGPRLIVEVWDQAPGVPVPRNADANAESGRGLALVGGLSSAWGWYPLIGQPGKCIWAEISDDSLIIQIRSEPVALPCPGRSRAEGPPVSHDLHEPVGLDAPERGNDGAARHAVLLGQLCHRGQPLLGLPFTLVDPRA